MDNNKYLGLIKNINAIFHEKDVNIYEAAEILERCKTDVLNRMLESEDETIFVLKRNGKVQKFDEKKLCVSIANASDEIQEPLNSSDINIIVNTVIRKLKEKHRKVFHSGEIRNETLETLKESGFYDVYIRYRNFLKE